MKLAPRTRRSRPDYLLDNAADLQLGKLFLRWGASKRSGRRPPRKRAMAAAKKKESAAPAAAVKSPTPRKAAATMPKSKQVAAAPSSKAAAAPTPKSAAKSPKAAASTSPKSAAATPKAAAAATTARPPAKAPTPTPVRPTATPSTKSVMQRRGRMMAALPVVIPTPVATPAMPAPAAAAAADTEQLISINVRTMNGNSFRLVLTGDTILYELKRQILGVISPAAPQPGGYLRLPMLVMNGRALMPDNASLRALNFTPTSTVFCFPEPS